jgi:hypothetical protein
VAKRQIQLEANLESTTQPTNWRDKFQVGVGTPKKDTDYQRKTYLLDPEMVAEIASLAKREEVPINDLVRFLLGLALQEVASGEVTLPVRVITVEKRRVN